MRSLSHDATSALLRAVRGSFAIPVTVEEVRSRAWASATFVGARHELRLRLEGEHAGPEASAFAAAAHAAEFALNGHIVADLHLAGEERGALPGGQPFVRLTIEALTVEES